MKPALLTPWLKREIVLLLTWMLFMFVIGAIKDSIWLMLFIGLLGYVVWCLYNLNQLTMWLANPSKHMPESLGLWDEVYYQLHHLYKRQRKARRKLTSIIKRFHKSTRALPYATIVLNELNEIEWFNPAARQLFNLYSKVDVGQRIDNLIRQPAFVKYILEKNFSEPLTILNNNKKLLLTITPYGSGQNLVIARDITASSQLDDMRRDFISNASHELRTPLTVMSGYIEFLQDRADAADRLPLDNVQQQIMRMNNIIAELIELARLESAAAVDYNQAIDLDDLLNEVYNEALTFDNQVHHIELQIESKNLHTDNDQALHGSRKEIRMALSNLMTNAIRYTPDGGDIKLFSLTGDSSVAIGVQDSGFGISYEHIPRLTERFYRVDEGRSRDQGGTGLGLAIVKHVLDRHNANLHITSEPGAGSTFRCDFPLSTIEH